MVKWAVFGLWLLLAVLLGSSTAAAAPLPQAETSTPIPGCFYLGEGGVPIPIECTPTVGPVPTHTPAPTYTPTPTFTAIPTGPSGSPVPGPTWTSTPRPQDGFTVKVCTGGFCSYKSLGNSMGGQILSEVYEGLSSSVTVDLVSVPSWINYATMRWVVTPYRGTETLSMLPASSWRGLSLGSYWWGDGYWVSHPSANDIWAPFYNVPGLGMENFRYGWGPPTTGITYLGPMGTCLHPEWSWPLYLNDPAVSLGGVSLGLMEGIDISYRVSLYVDSVGPNACWTPQPSPSPTYIPNWLTPIAFPTIIVNVPTIVVNVTIPPIVIGLTTVPYPTPVPSPTPNPTPVIVIGGGGTESCTTYLPDFGLHETYFGQSVNFDFPGLRMCWVPYDIALNLWGIDFTKFVLAGLAISLFAAVYSLVRTS